MKFRLITMLWVFALLASAMATFGSLFGVFWSFLVFSYWGWGFKDPRPTLQEWFVVLITVLALTILLLPSLQASRGPHPRAICMNHMRCIALALYNYAEREGNFPVSSRNGPDGKAWHSWRYTILPEMEYTPTYHRYDPNQPWDATANKQVVAEHIDYYRCRADPGWSTNLPYTSYFAVIGPDTMWPESRGRRIEEVTDPHDQTILVLEAAGKNILWAEPKDFTFAEAVDYLTSKHADLPHVRHAHRPGFFYKPPYETSPGIHAAFADGSVRFLPLPLSRETAVALLTCNGGEEIEDFDQLTAPQLDYGRIWGLSLFVLLSLAPSYRRFKAKTQSDEDRQKP